MHKPLGRPQVVAHRGSSRVEAEHTLAAYVRALDDGADALECDVRLTADGHLVCVHDRRIDRTTGRRGVVSTMTLTELAELDAAAWKHPWRDLDDEAEPGDVLQRTVLPLRTLLELVADYDRVVDLALETKHPTRFGGLVERRLVDLLTEFDWIGPDSPARVMSFSAVALTRVQRLAPDLELVLLFEGSPTWQLAGNLLLEGWIAGPGVAELRERPRLVRKLLATGRRVHVWTVNTPADLALCRELGVEAVITDTPREVLRILARPED